jgi:hypothetical protein
MGQNMYFLSKLQQGGGFDDNMLAVGKIENLGQTAGGDNSVVFAFVNNNSGANPTVAATYDLNAKLPGSESNYFGIDRGRLYNVRDLLADNPNQFVWRAGNGTAEHRTGADLIEKGLYVSLPDTRTGSGSHQAQYLQLVDVSPSDLSFSPPQLATFGTTVTLAAVATPSAPVTYTLVGGDTAKATLNLNQLTINSGNGSVIVRATVADTPERAGTSVNATITFQKATQTITFTLDPSSVAAAGTLALTANSTSGLPITYASSNTSFATVNGTTLTGVAAGNVTITASQPGNDNFTAAESVTQTLTVTAAGDTFESLFSGQDPTSDIDKDGIPALVEFALGGSSTANDADRLPQLTRDGNTMRLTAVIRNTGSTVTAQSSTSLGGAWTTGIQGSDVGVDQNGVAPGFTRKVFSFDATTNTRAFMRLHVQKTP